MRDPCGHGDLPSRPGAHLQTRHQLTPALDDTYLPAWLLCLGEFYKSQNGHGAARVQEEGNMRRLQSPP